MYLKETGSDEQVFKLIATLNLSNKVSFLGEFTAVFKVIITGLLKKLGLLVQKVG